MNKEQIFSQLRVLTIIALTYLVSTGRLTQEQATQLTNALTQAAPIIIIIGTMAFGWWKKRDKAVIEQAAKTGVTILVPASASPGAQAAASDPNIPAVTSVKP